MHHLDANKTAGEEAKRQLHKNVESNIWFGLVWFGLVGFMAYQPL